MKVVCFDLDDTLYKEIDYLRSAYKEIVTYSIRHSSVFEKSFEDVYLKTLDAYMRGENAFEFLNLYLQIDIPVNEYLRIYRSHKPNISLTSDARRFLNKLNAEGHVIGLITDGRSIQQRNKIEKLDLWNYIQNDDIIISEEFGTEKPSFNNYTYFMDRYPLAERFIYVGDNVRKDFVAPNALGWKTICLKDDGRNIHKQDLIIERGFLPNIIVESFSEISL